MPDFPAPVSEYLSHLALEHRNPAYLHTSPDGELISSGGNLSTYGLDDLEPGVPLGEQMLVLAGRIPLTGSAPAVLECMQTEGSPPADVHLIPGSEGDWIILLDASEAEFKQRQLQQHAYDLSLSFQKLIKEIDKKEILLHCIVHDLAGPLMGIRGGFELLATEKLSEQGRNLLDIGLRQAGRQEVLIRDILRAFAAEVEQVEAFSTDRESAPDALSAAHGVISLLFPAFERKQVRLRLSPHIDASADWKVVGERSRLERVFSNLIENALRHSPSGSEVEVSLEVDNGHIVASIDDQGPGVPPEVADQLFQKFAQGKGKTGKIGLGLYFCRITVEHWGGAIGQKDLAAGGSRFWFRLLRP